MADANSAPPSDAPRKASTLHDGNDLDPAAFLKSVRELSEKREREDAERYRKLEEEVQKGREERAARRAERARSISPEKQQSAASTPANRNLSRTTTNASLLSSPPVAFTPPPVTPSARKEETLEMASIEPEKTPSSAENVPEFKGFGSIKRSSTASSRSSSQAGAESATSSAPSASNLARSGTLSWQQRPRPGSKLGGPRPMSMASVESAAAHNRNTSADEPEQSRDQIAASLGARDPSWFRQTADRGAGNAAFRRSKDETSYSETSSSSRRGLPGMSRELSKETERPNVSPTSESARSDAMSRGGSIRESTLSNNSSRYSATSTSSNKPDLKSLIAADEDQQRASPSFDQSSIASGDSGSIARTLTMSSSQARLGSIDRPVSPTKGMGGFVQSAMMKRSDSQNKRWSAQPAGGLSRHGSSASIRHGLGGLQGSHSMPKLEPAPSFKDTSSETLDRPPSSSNNDLTSLAATTDQDKDVFVKPALPHHSRSKSVASNYSANEDSTIPPSPGSPSKRWSPNKSSWIESSLTRPESPKPAPSKNAQPSWMADLAKAKAQRASQDLTGLAKPTENEDSRPPSRPGSPLKATPFGPALLKRSESRPGSALGGESAMSSETSAVRGTPTGRERLSEAQALPQTPQSSTPTQKLKPLRLADKFTSSPAGASPTVEAIGTPEAQQVGLLSEEKQRDEDQDQNATLSTLGENPSAPTTPSATTLPRKQTISKPAPGTPPKPVTDFRSQLKSRPRAETKTNEEPEFLSKFGNLRRTQQEKFVAPDVLKDNILRGKSGLAVTGGPVKTERKDELKESLLAKKDDWRKAKDEGRELPGQAHERKISATAPIQAPIKPEALAKRELLGRSDSNRSVQQAERQRESTPEALSRHKSLKQKPAAIPSPKPESVRVGEAKVATLHKQVSAPSAIETPTPKETSKLAARFNPALAGILARGPPSSTPSRPETPGTPGDESDSPVKPTVAEPPAASAPLQDVRKDRAKGPKRRKGGAQTNSTLDAVQTSSESPLIEPKPSPVLEEPRSIEKSPRFPTPVVAAAESTSLTKPKPQALPGSAGSLMRASLNRSALPDKVDDKPTTPSKQSIGGDGAADLQKPMTFAKSPALVVRGSSGLEKPIPTQPNEQAVPEFKGFGAARAQRASLASEENKENDASDLPSVKSVASQWGRRPSLQKTDGPSQIQLPTKKDEEEAMRSAGLLASSSSRPRNGFGISADKTGDRSPATPPASGGLPPKPTKSSRTVSGQLAEASANKGLNVPNPIMETPKTEAGRLLISAFGSLPKYTSPLTIDTAAVLSIHDRDDEPETKTLRKSMQVVSPDGLSTNLPPRDEYTFFDESVYLCTHVYTTNAAKATQVFIWAGGSASETSIEAANAIAKRMAKENGSASIHMVRQGQESASFLRAVGGIFITRWAARENAPKQYMLCGRKHHGHIVFDEVDFGAEALCAGFVFLISYPVTLQETRLYVWKGQACSTEELSAARLAAMDLSETGEIIEVDGGAEFPSFLKIYGANTTKANVIKPSSMWEHKSRSPDKFKVRLYRIQPPEAKTGLFTSLWNRRPSWNSLSPAREDAVKVEAKEISPFTQAQLDAEGIYMLDAHSELYILIGPLLASQPERIRDTLLAQTLLFASDYAILSASTENRAVVLKCHIVWSGVPRDVKMLFRHWDDSQGLWGTAGLMAGSMSTLGCSGGVKLVSLEEMLAEVCRA